MAVKVKLPTQLRDAAGNQAEARVEGSTVGEALSSLYDQHAELRSRMSDDGGALRRFVNVYLRGGGIPFPEGPATPGAHRDEPTIPPPLAGGSRARGWTPLLRPDGPPSR